MKILITTDLYTTDTNGVVTSTKNLRDALIAKGHEVRVLTISENRKSYVKDSDPYIKSVSLERIYPNVRMPLSYHNRYIKEIIEWKPDIIHSQCEFFTLQFALKVSKKTGAPIVHTYHTMYEEYVGYAIPGKRFGRWAVKKFTLARMKKIKTVIVPTEKIEKLLCGYGVPNEIAVIPSGIKLERHRVRISKEERIERRLALGIGEGERVLINLGRLGTEKNIEELIEGFGELSAECENLRLLIVGDGPAREGLEKLAHKLSLDGKVIFAGMVKPCEVSSYYQLGDIFVSASTSETQGLTYIEAAANGLALICRRDDCLEGVIEEGVNGYQYSDVGEFKSFVRRAIADPEWLESAGVRSAEIVSKFDNSYFGDSVEEVYKKALKNK